MNPTEILERALAAADGANESAKALILADNIREALAIMKRGEKLVELVKSLEVGHGCVGVENCGTWVSTDWLVGPFAGRSFSGKDAADAAERMARYFDENKGNRSTVGQIVADSGWPDLTEVRSYVLATNELGAEDIQR